MADLSSILGGMVQGFKDFGTGLVDMFGTGGAAIGDAIASIQSGRATTKNQDDFRKWLYNTDSTKDAAAKGLGTILNGVSTVADVIPGSQAVTANPLFNGIQGAIGGVADELKMAGENADLGRAAQRAGVGAASGLASAYAGQGLAKTGNKLLSNGLTRGAVSGALGGGIANAGYTGIEGGSVQDMINAGLYGAQTGALVGGTTGLARELIKPAHKMDVALTDEEKAARIANIDDQIGKLDLNTPEGSARYDELMRARAVYNSSPDKIQRLYHQTSANSFDEFSPERRSAGVMDQGTPSGIFLKDGSEDIGLPGKNQLMFDVKMENPYEAADRAALTNYARSRSKTYANLYDQAVELDQKAANVYNDFTEQLEDKYKKYYYEPDAAKKALLKQDVDDLVKNIGKLSKEKAAEYRSKGAEVAQKAQNELNRILKQDGYDSVILNNDKGSFGRSIKSYIALDPYEQLAEVKPKTVADLMVESKPKTIYHGTNAVFEDFDESLPSVWFTDNADDIANTGLSNKGGKINIMERELPNNLKLADWDLADRLTKQQLIDRGYDGIAYTESGTSGKDTYYEIFKPNKTLKKIGKAPQKTVADLMNEPKQKTVADLMLSPDDERRARIANIDDQLAKLDTSTQEGIDRHNELMNARNKYANIFYHGRRATPTETGDTLGEGMYMTTDSGRASGYAKGGGLESYDASNLKLADLDDIVPEDVAKVLSANPQLSDRLKALTPVTETFADRDAAYSRWNALKNEFPVDQMVSRKTATGYEITYPGEADYSKITGKDIFRKLTTPEAQGVYMDAGYDGVSKTALGGDTEVAVYRNKDRLVPRTVADLMAEPKQKTVADLMLSPEQEEFFKDSVIRDENGNLKPMYHGTRGDFTVFGDDKPYDGSNSHASVGHWFTPTEEGAQNFANSIWYGDGDPKVMKTYLNIKNPKIYETVDNSAAIEPLVKRLQELELDSSKLSDTELYRKNIYHASTVQNMINLADKDTAVNWLSREKGYEKQKAIKLVDEIADIKRLADEKANLQNEISELKYGDAYQQFKTDLYKVDGQTANDANAGGVGMVLNDKNSIKKYVDKLKSEGYDGIVIKGTKYDADVMGGTNDQYVAFDSNQIKSVNNKKPTKSANINYALAGLLGTGGLAAALAAATPKDDKKKKSEVK